MGSGVRISGRGNDSARGVVRSAILAPDKQVFGIESLTQSSALAAPPKAKAVVQPHAMPQPVGLVKHLDRVRRAALKDAHSVSNQMYP
jgi:hypothetical protein